jgi:acyl-CoA reductase-like NAD-dependent aldehyde dehydrogenase
MAAVKELENFINGEFVRCGRSVDSYNPATGKVHLKIPDSGKEEVDTAVKAAKTAFKKSVILLLF